LYALTVEDAPGHTDAAELAARQELTADEIERLCSFARDNGGIDYAFAAMKNLRDRGARLLEAVPDCPQRHELLDLFDFIIARDH
jgi:octaprenyl-diphosphate synthase